MWERGQRGRAPEGLHAHPAGWSRGKPGHVRAAGAEKCTKFFPLWIVARFWAEGDRQEPGQKSGVVPEAKFVPCGACPESRYSTIKNFFRPTLGNEARRA